MTMIQYHRQHDLRLARPVRWRAVLLVVAGLATGGTAFAQSRHREPERIEPGLLHLHRVDADLEFESTIEQFRVRSKNGSGVANAHQTNRSAIHEGVLTLRFNGDIVHPYLVDFYGSLGLGFSHSYFREERFGRNDTSHGGGYLTEFDLRADLFKNKQVSGTVYGQRGDDRIARLFLPSLHEQRVAYGTAWSYRSDPILMELAYDRTDTQRYGNRMQRDDEHITEDRLTYSLDWTIDKDQKLQLDLEHSRRRQEYQGSRFKFDTRRDQLKLDYDLAFGSRRQHRFVTYVRIQEESGDLARDLIEIGPQLILEHSENLSTSYSYQFTRERLDGFEVDQHRGDFQLTHRLYKNLTTTIDVFGLEERTEDAVETTQVGASVDWQYVRKNPYGQLTAELRLAGDSERTRGNNGNRLMLNESGTFRDPLPLYLVKPHAILASIFVTDVTGRIFYRLGTDYAVIWVKDRVALWRIPTGRIVNGQTVLIDYRYRTPANGQIDTTRIDFNIEQAFDSGWTPYYRLSFRDQDVDRSTGFAFRADRTDHHRLGVRYAAPRWSASAEYEIYDDAVDPYDAFHLTGQWNALRSPTEMLDLRGSFSQYFFDGGWDEREVSEVNLSAVHELRLNDFWSTSLASTYRWEDDSIRGTTNALDLEGVLAYRRENMSLELSLEYDLLRIAGSREDGLAAWINLHWELEDVLND